ncbi:hypothetical protein [Paenibacillus glycinis]|uniref:Uncharacterized protein n=1 Tax=Paenibacillus glycinis TaxID=2697035 RepID=A0ABW9XL18_9BACL|nr:hypothetical protein [Paenibacillus glycinis]NBD23142.1 hypothetical protein [Paenibacillus glycinis]
MDNGISVVLYEKSAGGELIRIDERTWSLNMVASLEHVNYITVGAREYETLEGRLNLDNGKLEILVVPMQND